MIFRGRYVLLMYVICIGTVTLVWNWLEGNLIQDWYRIGGGHLRQGKEFDAFASLFGIWVFPFAIASGWLFFWQAFSEDSLKSKAACFGRAAVCVYFIYRFHVLGLVYFVQNNS